MTHTPADELVKRLYEIASEDGIKAGHPRYPIRVRNALREAAAFIESQSRLLEPTHRHVKRGTTYTVVGEAKMQSEGWVRWVAGWQAHVDMEPVVVYRSTEDGSLWVRPKAEFEDGRFEALSVPPRNTESEK